ncbi:hypothetical protein KY290_000726 [Solanum tuberosum]|uniref:Retrotransposon Copia-like N-terminal domain-containing protein n=1 Tax=Solanum tuberosum TaxID=4113 RepID=A0ABQ7WK98_SOLTU|nr:hypothetical protein KY290_000726 [Solanum tuberosum]
MSHFNPLSTILGQNKLEGSNYVDWRRNLDIVLTAEEYKFVLHEKCPPKPNEQSSDEDKLAYQKWRKADEMARCYILASMSNGKSAKQTAMRTLMNTKMVEGTPVRDHVMNMIGLLNELEMSLSLAQLLNELQAAETLVKKAPSMALDVEKGSTSKSQGHWKAHCPLFLAKKKNNPGSSLSLVVETFLAAISTTSWCVDSGATDHICTTLLSFKKRAS